MTLQVANNAFGELNADINTSVTTIVLKSGNGARFPSLAGSQYFYATLIDTNNNLEIVKATARSSDTLTVVRAQDGTSARSFVANDRLELRPVAAFFDTYQQKETSVDMNGTELILDADADTSITADTDDRIDFKTAGSDRMKINSNGSVGIASDVTTSDLNIGAGVGSYATIQMTPGGATTGNIIYFGDSTDADYSSITSFGSNAGENGRIRFIAGTKESLNILNNGNVNITDGNLVVANGHGIDFSAKSGDASGMAAELFDDYEEGMWDATLTPQTSGSTTVNSDANNCQYTKIGRMVFLSGLVQVGSVSSPVGVLRMSGLPFAVANLNDYGGRTLATINIQAGAIPPNNYGMWFSEGDSFGSIYNFTSSEQPQATASNNFGGNESIYFSVMYRTS